MKVGYLGPKNSFTFQAANTITDETDLIAYPSIPFCIQALEENKISFAVVPIENSLEGSVHASIDRIFHQEKLFVAGEIVLPIRQQLLGHSNEQPITKILSHPQALAQSQRFLETTYPLIPLEAVASTTFAAEYVANHPEEHCAAIASDKAASEYDLTILAHNIQDNALNQTRFWVLTATKDETLDSLGQPARNTLFLTLPDNLPGALHKVLSCFAWRNIDLSKIESRPLKTSLGEYFFIVDLTLEGNQALIENAIEEIELLKGHTRNIGSYPVKIIH